MRIAHSENWIFQKASLTFRLKKPNQNHRHIVPQALGPRALGTCRVVGHLLQCAKSNTCQVNDIDEINSFNFIAICLCSFFCFFFLSSLLSIRQVCECSVFAPTFRIGCRENTATAFERIENENNAMNVVSM